jgi:sialic acid synthase SpsE
MKINLIDTDQQTFIVAEIGNNHEGDFDVAQELIQQAAKAGADAVKFQTFLPEYLAGGDKARFERLKMFQFSYEKFSKLALVAQSEGIIFFSTPFDPKSADFLNEIQPVFKIASSDNTHWPFLQQIAHFGKPVILSTGMTTLSEINEMEKVIRTVWNEQNCDPGLALLHCVSSYPTPAEQANLKAIKTLAKHFPNCVPGYSDHTFGITAALSAVAMGARVIEKHFTLDKNYSDFRDHQLSADPTDLKELVSHIRELERMLGSGEKAPQPNELVMQETLRRSAAAGKDLKKGTVVSELDLIWVRHGSGVTWDHRDNLVGKKLNRDCKYADLITIEDLHESK